ncbi:membrane-associated protease RseP (regulator of RpoE activity) [Nocardioides zeae]|uniref:Membrane-associated protease RseP (Regulator of RpoE activity) n=1 Tax=Nocardioides zeae TaxID=1457234 RepID=A0ACC6IHG0_9ACTN|nr:site-2 protease family protein [Nocardioides zeae]MDR6173138.1 membrane-associated protease RseP (regulator of RpoE activity) [Nocardioides zeae]MDR6210131.1 membrane-associated protease RseP (regulator of RpoE activity) [Nocardioides zeae]
MTAALLYTLGVVVFVVAILVSIALHELGHMIPAKAFGGKVTQYFVGFGPTVWSRQVGETEYGVKAIPLGGYVKIVGMLPPGADDLAEQAGVDPGGEPVYRVRKSNTGMFTQLVSDARAAEWETIGPEDADRLFYKMPPWKKIVVMAAGPTVNIAIAFGIFAGVFATYGNPDDQRTTTTVGAISQCVVPYAESGRECTADDPVTPAVAAGLQPGDEIVAFNGTRIGDWRQMQDLIRGNSDGEAQIVVERDGRELTLTTNTTVTARPSNDEDADPAATTEVGFLGVTPTTELGTGGPIYTLDQMGTMAVRTVEALVQLPAKVFGVGRAIVGLQERDPESPVSIVGGGRIAGETTALEEFPVQEKVVFLLLLIAGFNFFIGMFNFIPLLPLDGGHIAGAAYEGVRRRLARLRRRPDPGYVDVARLLPVAYVVGSAILVMGVVLIVGDLVVPLSPYS